VICICIIGVYVDSINMSTQLGRLGHGHQSAPGKQAAIHGRDTTDMHTPMVYRVKSRRQPLLLSSSRVPSTSTHPASKRKQSTSARARLVTARGRDGVFRNTRAAAIPLHAIPPQASCRVFPALKGSRRSKARLCFWLCGR
jgi:hypothetical protein